MSRPRCSAFIAMSLDGYIARKDGSIDWLGAVERPGEDYGFRQFFETVDTLVIGRRTYETALGFPSWPFANKRCVVLTHGTPATRHGEEIYAGDPGPLVDRLGAEGTRRLYVDGGVVIRSFLAAGLVDDLTVSLIPVLLGGGVSLFADGSGIERRLKLGDCRSYESGLVRLGYTRVSAAPAAVSAALPSFRH